VQTAGTTQPYFVGYFGLQLLLPSRPFEIRMTEPINFVPATDNGKSPDHKTNRCGYMLTATPINNRLSDFRHMAELFTRRDEAYFARTLGVNNLRAHFNNMEKALRKAWWRRVGN